MKEASVIKKAQLEFFPKLVLLNGLPLAGGLRILGSTPGQKRKYEMAFIYHVPLLRRFLLMI